MIVNKLAQAILDWVAQRGIAEVGEVCAAVADERNYFDTRNEVLWLVDHGELRLRRDLRIEMERRA